MRIESIKCIKKKYKNNVPSKEEIGRKISLAQKGKKLSLEHCKKISEGNKGRRHNNDSKLKISVKNSGKGNGMYGKLLTMEEKIKRSNGHKKNGIKVTGFIVKPINYKTSKVDPKIKEKIIEIYLNGKFMKKDISTELNIKYSTVHQTIRDHIIFV